MENKRLIKTAVELSLKKYNLNDTKTINIFTNIAYKTIKKLPTTNDEILVKQTIMNSIDRYMIEKAKTDNDIYKIIENDLMKTLNISCKIAQQKFKNVEDLEYYKEYAVLKAIETYSESITKSINRYANDWFLAFINKEVNEESKSLILK